MNPIATLNYRIVPAPNNEDECRICTFPLRDYPFGDHTVSSDRALVAHEEGGNLHPLHRFCIRDWTRRLNQANCPTCALETNIVALATLKTRTEKFWDAGSELAREYLPSLTPLAMVPAILSGTRFLMPQYPVVLSAVAKTLMPDDWLGQHTLENSRAVSICAAFAFPLFGAAIGTDLGNLDRNITQGFICAGFTALCCAMLLESDRCMAMGASGNGGNLAAVTLGAYVGLAAASMYGLAQGIKHRAELIACIDARMSKREFLLMLLGYATGALTHVALNFGVLRRDARVGPAVRKEFDWAHMVEACAAVAFGAAAVCRHFPQMHPHTMMRLGGTAALLIAAGIEGTKETPPGTAAADPYLSAAYRQDLYYWSHWSQR